MPRRPCLVLTALFWLLLLCRSRWTSAGFCLHATDWLFTEDYCYIAHYKCRESFSPDVFASRFGADWETCQTLPHDFVRQVLARVTDLNVVVDPELDNCRLALNRVSCEELVTDALLQPGRPCNPDVIGGVAVTTEQYTPDCDDEVEGGGCRMGD
jgi:hypothetical protein